MLRKFPSKYGSVQQQVTKRKDSYTCQYVNIFSLHKKYIFFWQDITICMNLKINFSSLNKYMRLNLWKRFGIWIADYCMNIMNEIFSPFKYYTVWVAVANYQYISLRVVCVYFFEIIKAMEEMWPLNKNVLNQIPPPPPYNLLLHLYTLL